MKRIKISSSVFLFFLYASQLCLAQGESEVAKARLDSARIIAFTDIDKTKKLYKEAKKAQPYATDYYYYILMVEAGFYTDLGEFETSKKIIDSLINQNKFEKYKAYGHKELGLIATRNNEVEKAITELQKAIKIFESLDEAIEVSTCLKLLGNLLFANENSEEARAYYKRAAKISILSGDSLATGLIYNNIVRTYVEDQMIDSAVFFNNRIFKILENLHGSRKKNSYVELKFSAYLNDSDFKGQQNNFANAKKSLDSALIIAQNTKIETMLGVVYQLKAVNLKREGKFSESLQYGEMALNIFKNENRTNYYLQTLYQVREIAAKDFNYEKAYRYALEYEKHQDSINAKELDNNLKDLRLKYETAEKELKIAQQQKDIIKTESRQKTTTIIATSLGILSLLIFLIYRQRQKTQKQKIVSLENEKENIALKSLMAGEEKERSRIAKELHDGIGSLLAASKMHASALLTKDPEASETLISLLDNASNEARRISHNLLPESLINKGLDVALQDFVETINEGKLLQVEYQSINFKHNLPQSTQLTIYRIVQELLNNIIKHSGATEAFVQLTQNDKKLIITVEDNGRGFSGGTDFKGIGLQNIESRLSLLNGKIEVDSKETMGTSVYIEFEIEK